MFKAVGVKQNMKDVDEIWDSYKLIWVDRDFLLWIYMDLVMISYGGRKRFGATEAFR